MNFSKFLKNRPTLTVETLVLTSTVYMVLFCNASFWSAFFAEEHRWTAAALFFPLATFIGLVCLHFSFLNLICSRRTAKPLPASL
ncbi:MAG: hypothetical protein DRJ65_19385 [Acidobacteria bacterium]|nr:MAG: hypothetical protein DRJ65_19385 [Acidobacteriota bacterium]